MDHPEAISNDRWDLVSTYRQFPQSACVHLNRRTVPLHMYMSLSDPVAQDLPDSKGGCIVEKRREKLN